jgi:hypothetical protein
MPAGREDAEKMPSALVVTFRRSPVSLLVMETDAAGTTAPDSSKTVPLMLPTGA